MLKKKMMAGASALVVASVLAGCGGGPAKADLGSDLQAEVTSLSVAPGRDEGGTGPGATFVNVRFASTNDTEFFLHYCWPDGVRIEAVMESGRVMEQYSNGGFVYIDPDGNPVESDEDVSEKAKETLCGVGIESGEKTVELRFKRNKKVVATMDVSGVPVQATKEKSKN